MAITARQIEAFRATMLTGSTRAASEKLFVTQPVISRLLAQLEQSVGYSLFVRKGNSLIPNDNAAILLESANRICAEIDVFRDVAKNIGAKSFKTIKIFCSPTLSTSVLPGILARKKAVFQGTRFEVYSRLIDKLPDEIVSHKNAIGISIWTTQDKGVNCELLAQRRLSVAIHPDNPLSQRTLITRQDLLGERIITYSQKLPLGRLIAEDFAAWGSDLQAAYLIENSEIAYSLVRQNLGVAIIDSFSQAYLRQLGLKVIGCDIPVSTNLCLISSKLFAYGSELSVIRQSIEAWLLDDTGAIT